MELTCKPLHKLPDVFAKWSDDAGVAVDVRLQWHPSLPSALPATSEEAICVVQVCAISPSPGVEPEHLEARMQRHHLLGSSDSWTPERLKRLMAAMATPSRASKPAEDPSADMVLLRRGTGHMVIDVFFAEGDIATASFLHRHGGKSKVVELLNARPRSISARESITELLRAAVKVQGDHRRQIADVQAKLQSSRAALLALQQQWDTKRANVVRERRDRLRRFAVLLQAKVDKEHSLRAELAAQMAGPPVGPPPEPAAAPRPTDPPETNGPRRGCGRGAGERRGRGRGRGRRGSGRGVAVPEPVATETAQPPAKRPRTADHDSILSAATIPLPGPAAAMGTAAALFEPDAANDVVDRRRATIQQALLEPDVGKFDVSKHRATMAMLEPDAADDEVPLLCNPSPSMPPPSMPQSVPAASLSQKISQRPASLGLFDPVSSDEEANDKPPAFTSAPGDVAAANAGSLPSRPAPPLQTPAAAPSHQTWSAKGLFFSDDEG